SEVAWRAAVSAGRLPVARGVVLTDEDRFRGEVIERLMCDFAVDLEAVAARHGFGMERLADELHRLRVMASDGLVQVRGGALTIGAPGRVLAGSVAAVCGSYLDVAAGRHARAV